MQQKKKISRKVISYVLALVMVFSTMTGIVPGMSITAQASEETLLTTITPTGTDTYSESPAGVVNVTLSNIKSYSSARWSNGGTVTVTQKEGYTITKCRFVTRRGNVDDTVAPFSIDVGSATYVSSVEVYGYQTSPYASIINTTNAVKFADWNWYLIEYDENENTVTLLSKECVGASKFNEDQSNGYEYSGSTVESFVNKWYADKISADARAAVNGSGMFLLTKDQANKLSTEVLKCSQASGAYDSSWWLCSPGTTATSADRVKGDTGTVSGTPGNVWIAYGVRPALKLDLSKVTFDSDAKTFALKQTVTAPEAATGLTYKKDQAQALLTSGASVTTGNTATGSIQYRVGTDGEWSTKIPTGTNAGEYKVYYKVLGDDTYAEYAAAEPISVTIAKADPVPLLENAYSAKYGQYAKNVTLPEGWKWADPEKKFESTGEVVLTANFAESDNYIAKTKSISVLVVKAAAKISYTFSEVVKEYGSTSFTNDIENTGDATPTYESSNESVATVDETGLVTIQGIGEATITANVANDTEHYTYETRTASYKLTVNPISTAINTPPTAADITYGQKLSESTLSGGVVNVPGSEETVAGTFAWKEPDLVPNASDSGEYEVEFTPANTNYAKSTCQVTIKVNKKTVSATELEDAQKPVAKTGDDTVYTGEPIELVTAPTADLPLDYEAFYSTDDGDSWSKDIPKKEDPGTYIVKVKYVSKGGNCNDIILDNITATITPADKTALTDAIAAAKEYYDTIKGNTDYKEAADKLDKAIKAAEEVAAKNKLTKSEVSTAAEALNTAKTTAEAEVKDIDDTKAAQAVIDKINELKPVENIKPEDRTKIEAAREAYKKLTDDQKTKLTGLDSTAVSTLEAAEQALDTAEKAAFDAEKEAEKKAADALAAEGDSDASKKLIEDAKKAINELAYDKSKSVDENKAALAAIVSKLKSDLTDNRAAEKKEADDTAAAKKVTDAINALPASDKVATTDKAAIEAARKAYDALTADQKKKVPADVLKKLTDAENTLKAAEKKEAEDAANAATAKKVVDAINKLPVASKVTVPNKAAIEAARKAYNSLTAEQKKNVPADVLKKLTDDEKALAAATAADKAAKELAAAKEEAQAAMNEQVTVTQKGKKFTVKWKKSTSADGYYVYASYCGKKATKPAKTIKKNTTTKVTISKINGKKISTKKNFHVYVVPYKIIDGKKVALGKSTVVHLVGAKSTKYSNVKKLTLKKTKYTVKVGKTAKIKAKVTLVNKNKKHIPKSHGAKFRYKSSDTSIATVDKNGKIKGIKKGKCTIYVYSINGLTKKAQITVK